MLFTGRNIAVTGGSSGIGLEIVKGLASLQANVYVADFSKEIPAELQSLPNVHVSPGCDVSDRKACEAFLSAIPGRLDGLVNNAGVGAHEGKVASDQTYRRVIETNLLGTFLMGTEALKRMDGQDVRTSSNTYTCVERRTGKGVIVNMSSTAGLQGVAGLAVYAASKHGVVGLARAWSKDFPGIRTNTVAPGATDTPLFRGNIGKGGDDEKMLQGRLDRIPMGRIGEAAEVADVVIFLLSDSASFITGQTIKVNGGSG